MLDKTFFRYLGKLSVFTLTVWSFISGLLQGVLGYIDPSTFGPEQALAPLLPLFLTCLLNAGVVLWIAKRTSLAGRKLGALVFAVVFGVMFFLPQMESVYFNGVLQIPLGVIGATLVSGLGVGWVSAKVAVEFRQEEQVAVSTPPLKVVHPREKIVVLAVLYVIFYFVFGYYIAWQAPEVRAFYSGNEALLPFWAHLEQQAAGLFVLQFVRGVLWALIGYIVAVNLSSISTRERMILVGLALSVGLAFPILVPNPYMPWIVRRVHFVELLVENFLFGAIAAWLFSPNMRRAGFVSGA